MNIKDVDSSYNFIRDVGYVSGVTPDPELNTVRVGQSFYDNSVKYAYCGIKIYSSSGNAIMEPNKSYDFTFEGIYYNNYYASYKVDTLEFIFTHTDGTTITTRNLPNTTVTQGGFVEGSSASLWRVNSKLSSDKEVLNVTLRVYFELPTVSLEDSAYANYAIGYYRSSLELVEIGWLDGVISSIRNTLYSVSDYIRDNGGLISTIKTVIQNGFNSLLFDLSEVRDYVVDIFDTIKGIPGNIVDSLVDKFNELFVPSSDDFLALYSDFYAFLDEKMPLITQIITLCQNLSEKFVYSDVMNFITIPKIELPINNETFVLGPYRVPVVPEGFGFLQTACKTISSIVLVFLTVNFMISKIRQFLLEVQE